MSPVVKLMQASLAVRMNCTSASQNVVRVLVSVVVIIAKGTYSFFL